jgi:hypothetical protein
MFQKDCSMTTGQPSTTVTSSSQVSQLPPSSSLSYHTPPPADEEEFHISPCQTNTHGKPSLARPYLCLINVVCITEERAC